jgi:murein L,D-transpeptidase YcbB/YkuD
VLIGDKGVPIFISYLTARPNGQTIAFADDVYKLDGAAPAAKAVETASTADKK